MSSLTTAISDGNLSSDPNPSIQHSIRYDTISHPHEGDYASPSTTIPLTSRVTTKSPAIEHGQEYGYPSDQPMTRAMARDEHGIPQSTVETPLGMGGTMLSVSPPPVSSRIATIQRAFDIFTHVDEYHHGKLNSEQVYRALSLFDPDTTFSKAEVEHIIDVATASRTHGGYHQQQQQHIRPSSSSSPSSSSTPPPDRFVTFSEFYAIFACYTLMQSKFGSNTTFLTRSQVSSALLEAGLDPSSKNLQHMFNVKATGVQLTDADTTALSDDDDDEARIGFSQLLRIYMHAPRSEGDLFLHSWYKAGRTNFLQHRKHIEASPPQDFVAGTMAGIAITLVGHPWDTVKVRLQTSQRFTGVLHCVKETFRNEGIVGFYKGMGGPMLTIPVINAIVFAAYSQAQRFLCGGRVPSSGELTLWQITLAGMYAGLVNCLVACPVELIKTRLQIQYNANTRSFDGPVDCVRQILKTSGIKGLFRGMSATIYRELPGYGGQFFMYELLKRTFMKNGNREEFELKAWELLFSGGAAGTFGWVCSYPMDYIKSAIQSEKWNVKTKFKKHPILLDGGFFSALQMTIKQKGVRELWKGFSACMIRGFPANAAGFLAYEESLKFMRRNHLFIDKPSSSSSKHNI